MGRSSSSNQANQQTNNNYADNKVANESGIVVGNGSLDLSDRSSTWTDLSDRSSTWTDLSDRSSTWTDLSDRSSRTNNWSSSSWDASTTNTATGSYNNTYTTDQGTVAAAFDFAKGNDATLGAGLASVLTFAKDITSKNSDNATSLASRFSDGVAQAYDSARNTTPGGIDNKTMIVLGVAAAAVVGAVAMSKKG